MSKTTTIIASTIGLLLVGVVAAFSFMSRGTSTSQTASPAVTASTDATKELTTTPVDTAATSGVTDGASEPTSQTSGYKDGTYKASGSYRTPGGTEEVTVTLTLKDGIVSNSSLSFAASEARESKQYQSQFSSGYTQYVVGKNLDEISVSRVSGSSLTSKGFNAALEQIKTQAKA